MDFIADLHTHSPFSRATSVSCDLAGMAAWARIKGIQVVGAADFTHPEWLRHLKEELQPAEEGLFRLRNGHKLPTPLPDLAPEPASVRFMLSAEISCIYKRHGKTRKVHNLLYVPDFRSAQRINNRLERIGNLRSDGRPILGLDSRDLLEILLEEAPEGFLVPAHIWTPWFSLFGSRSGFDSLEECFGDLAGHVFALETGLSSDPDMNRLISSLDRRALISSSDCHSPSRLGREATLFSTSLDFRSLRDAIKGNRRPALRGTVEFFPEEGKYHSDGHRNCKLRLTPYETSTLEGRRCPVCGKPLTVGVLHRVMALADRSVPLYPADAPRAINLAPLAELLSELLGVGPSSKEVVRQYSRAISLFGSELGLLLDTPLDIIQPIAPLLAEAIGRVRHGRVIREPGFDGQYGTIRVFEEHELPMGRRSRRNGEPSLFR